MSTKEVKDEPDFEDDVNEGMEVKDEDQDGDQEKDGHEEKKIRFIKYKCWCPLGGCAYEKGKKILCMVYDDNLACWDRVRHHLIASSHHGIDDSQVDSVIARFEESQFIQEIEEMWTEEEVQAWHADRQKKAEEYQRRMELAHPKAVAACPRAKVGPRPPTSRPPLPSQRSRSRSPRHRSGLALTLTAHDRSMISSVAIPVDLSDQIRQQTVNAMAFVRNMSNAVKCLRGCARFCQQAAETYNREADSYL